MGVSLYTSRVVLDVLGASDYGLYSVVGGVVAMFGFFNMAMSSATQRFLSFEIGKGDFQKLRDTFAASVNIHIGIALLIMLLAETLGLWFVNNKLNIDHDRMDAVNWVYQFSIFTFMVSIMQVPYNALLIAREKMNVYALLSIIDIVLKLAIVYLLITYDGDKLKLYSVLVFSVTALISLAYRIYCGRNFKESRYRFYYDKLLYSSMLGFSGWSLFGGVAAIIRGQGSNIVLNIFFGTLINAAYGISSQVTSAVRQFVSSFQVALNPQIIQTYAKGDLKQNHKLIFQGSKLSFFLLFIIICPIWLNIDFVLELWLTDVPEYTSIFIRLALLNMLLDSISGPLMIGAQATGRIKWYQITIGSIMLLDLPVSYYILETFRKPELSYIVTISITCTTLIFRLLFLRHLISFRIGNYFKEVLLNIAVVGSIGFFALKVIGKYVFIEYSFGQVLASSIIIVIINLIVITFVGLSHRERNTVKLILYEKILKKNKKE